MESPGVKILCIEDNQEYLALIVGLLANSGTTVCSCQTAESALQILSNEPIKLILLDLHLPGKGGLFLLESLARSFTWKTIPVIILTATEVQPLPQYPQVVEWISKSTEAKKLYEKICLFSYK